GAGVAPWGAGVVGRKHAGATRATVLVFGAPQELVVGAFACHLRRAEGRHADSPVCKPVLVEVDQGTGITRVTTRPGHVVHLPQERERGGGTGTRRARLAEPAHVLLAGLVVLTLSVADAKGAHRSGGQETECQRDRGQPPCPDSPSSCGHGCAATRPFECGRRGTSRVRHRLSPPLTNEMRGAPAPPRGRPTSKPYATRIRRSS